MQGEAIAGSCIVCSCEQFSYKSKQNGGSSTAVHVEPCFVHSLHGCLLCSRSLLCEIENDCMYFIKCIAKQGIAIAQHVT